MSCPVLSSSLSHEMRFAVRRNFRSSALRILASSSPDNWLIVLWAVVFSLSKSSILCRRLGAVQCTSRTVSFYLHLFLTRCSLPWVLHLLTWSSIDKACPSAAESLPASLPDRALCVTQRLAPLCLRMYRHLSVCSSWPSPCLSWKWLGLHLTLHWHMPYDDDTLDLNSISGSHSFWAHQCSWVLELCHMWFR